MYQFLSSIPAGVWYALAAAVLLAVVFLCGGTAAAFLVTVIRGGKIKISKDGAEADAPEAVDDGKKA